MNEGICPTHQSNNFFLKTEIILGVFSAIFFCSWVFYQAGDCFSWYVRFDPMIFCLVDLIEIRWQVYILDIMIAFSSSFHFSPLVNHRQYISQNR